MTNNMFNNKHLLIDNCVSPGGNFENRIKLSKIVTIYKILSMEYITYVKVWNSGSKILAKIIKNQSPFLCCNFSILKT